MNKLNKIALALLGALETIFYLVSPILLVSLWTDFNSNLNWLFWLIGYSASVFRAIKVGWLK
jgi:hypothetical protein